MLERLTSRLLKIINSGYFQYGLLAAITLLAALLRFYKLGEWSFWIDEIFTINHAKVHYSSLEAITKNIPPARNWVPISVIFMAQALNALGVSEWSARFVPALIGVISIPLLYFPNKKVFGWQAALVASLLLAISPWHIQWSQNARYLVSLILFYSLALYAFYVWIERDSLKYMALFFLLFYFALSERLYALFIVPVIICYLLLVWLLPWKKPSGLRLRNLLLLIFPVIIVGVFEGINYFTLGNFRFFGDFNWFFLYRVDDPLRLLSFIAFNIGLPLMVFGFFGGLYLIIRRNRAGLLFFIGAVVPVGLLIILNPFIFTKDRYVFVTLTSWILLGAVAIKEIYTQTRDYGKILSIGVLFIFIVNAAGANLLYYQVNNGNRRDWKGAFTSIKNMSKEGDIIVSYWPELVQYYLDEEVGFWEDVREEMVINSDNRYWFVLDSETIWGNIPMMKWVENNAELVDVRYLRTVDDLYLRIYLYNPKSDIAPE